MEICGRCPFPATAHIRITARSRIRVEPARVLADEDVCGQHASAVVAENRPPDPDPDPAMTGEDLRQLIVRRLDGMKLQHGVVMNPLTDDGCMWSGDRERIAEAVLEVLGLGGGDG